MKTKEIRQMSEKDMEKKIKELNMELVKSKSSQSSGNAKKIKKMLARIKTVKANKSGGKDQK